MFCKRSERLICTLLQFFLGFPTTLRSALLQHSTAQRSPAQHAPPPPYLSTHNRYLLASFQLVCHLLASHLGTSHSTIHASSTAISRPLLNARHCQAQLSFALPSPSIFRSCVHLNLLCYHRQPRAHIALTASHFATLNISDLLFTYCSVGRCPLPNTI